MKLSFAIIASLIAATSASTIAATTASTMQIIMGDMTKIAKQFAKVDASLSAFPQSGIEGATKIHDQRVKLHDLFDKATNGITSLPSPVSAANAKKIIEAYQSVAPTAIHSLNEIGAKEADFVALGPDAPSMKDELITSGIPCIRFNRALQTITPPDMVDPLATMVSGLDTARTNAIAAFP